MTWRPSGAVSMTVRLVISDASAATGSRSRSSSAASRTAMPRDDATVDRRLVREADGAVLVQVDAVAEMRGHDVGDGGGDTQRLQVPEAGDGRALGADPAVHADGPPRSVLGDEARRQDPAVRRVHAHVATAVALVDVVGGVHGHDPPPTVRRLVDDGLGVGGGQSLPPFAASGLRAPVGCVGVDTALAQLDLAHLLRRRLRQLVDDADVAGDGERRELSVGERPHLVGGDGLIRLGHDEDP